MRRHVARGAGVGVLAPRAAHVRCLLEDRERLDPGALQEHSHPDAGETRPDDGHRLGRCHLTDDIIGETLYVHFRDKDDLVRTLAEEQIGALRARLRAARQRVIAGAGIEAVRETFRAPLETWIDRPSLFRLYAQEMLHPGSPLGAVARQMRDEVRRDLVEDLARFGLPAATAAERQRLDMIAEAMIAQTEALALAYIDGRYDDLEAVVDVLTRFAAGLLGLSG